MSAPRPPDDGPVEFDDASALAEHPLTAARLAKVEALREAGRDPYPPGEPPRDRVAEIRARHGSLAAGAETGERVEVAGRIVALRDIGKLVFAVIEDRGERLQLFVDASVLEAFDEFRELDVGDWVRAEGEVIASKRGELSVRVEDFTLLAKAIRPLPEKWHGLRDVETRYRRRYVDLIANPKSRTTLLARSRIVTGLRRALERREFLEVETPMLQSQPGGALARPFVTHHAALGIDMFLRIAPELFLKRLVVGGFDRVFEVNRNFRNEGLSPQHQPEFTMLEAYAAYFDYEDVMDLVEEVIVEAAESAMDTLGFEYQGRTFDLTPPWRRITMLGAIAEVGRLDVSLEMKRSDLVAVAADAGIAVDGAWGPGKIVTEIFERVVEPELWEPTLVMDYPKEVSPLAREHRSSPDLTERFEVFIAGHEIGNAFTELNDPVEQRRRFEAQAAARAEGDEEAHLVDEDYLRALEYGLPPTGGLGIGIDRLVMVLTDQPTIREVIAFPHLRPER